MNRKERAHLNAVASLGCIVCRDLGFEDSPAECHHIRTGKGRTRASHYETLPLCPKHHRIGGPGVAFHAGPKIWQEHYGSELELLARVNEEVGA